MDYITLGKTGLRISRVGFGGIPIQKVDANGARALFDVLIDKGINYVDTAKMYTVSEALIGQAIKGRRDKFVLATKSMARDRAGMEQDIATSLEALGTDYIDLYQVHNPNLDQLATVCAPGGALEALMAAKEKGIIGHIGVTAHSVAVFEAALALDWVETIMFPYNIVEVQGEALIARCAEKNVGFIAMKPLAGGAIEDAETAMRFVYANPAVTVVIPGMYNEDEVNQNLAAVEGFSGLNETDLARIQTIRGELGGNFCRRCNYCAPCAVGIQIPSVFLFAGYLNRYGLADWARDRYSTLAVKAGACVECGACETRCPYELPIRAMLADAARAFGE